MAEWTKVLLADPTEWLLDKGNPSVRYLTLTNILGKKNADPEVQRAKADIMSVGVRIPLKKATHSENRKPLTHSPNPLQLTMSRWLF